MILLYTIDSWKPELSWRILRLFIRPDQDHSWDPLSKLIDIPPLAQLLPYSWPGFQARVHLLLGELYSLIPGFNVGIFFPCGASITQRINISKWYRWRDLSSVPLLSFPTVYVHVSFLSMLTVCMFINICERTTNQFDQKILPQDKYFSKND